MKLFDHKECVLTHAALEEEPWKHYAEGRNSDTEGYILYNSIYMQRLEWASCKDKD